MEWKDHIVDKPRTYTISENADGTVTLIPAFGEVVQQGTMLNAANLNSMEAEIQSNAETHTQFVESLVGCVMWYAKRTPPVGWLECDGSAVSRTTYANLFAVIGTTYGAGNGSTTFNLPDLRGEFVRGWDHGRGADSGREFGGSQQGTRLTAGASSTSFARLIEGGDSADSISGSYNGSWAGSGKTPTILTRPRNVSLLPIIKY